MTKVNFFRTSPFMLDLFKQAEIGLEHFKCTRENVLSYKNLHICAIDEKTASITVFLGGTPFKTTITPETDLDILGSVIDGLYFTKYPTRNK